MIETVDFSKTKGMVFPRNVLIGHNTLPQVADMCDDFNFRNVGMMITGNSTYKSAGKLVEEYVTDRKYSLSVFKTDIATTANVEEAVNLGKETKSKFILAVGGGSKIDIAKLTAKKLKIPFISIPTSASHDGIASGRASLKEDMGPKSVDATSPMGILADTGIILKSPYRYLASGCADVISNMTALRDWDFARRIKNEAYSSSAASLAEMSATTIIDNSKLIKPGLEESIWIAMRPIIISGIAMAVAGSSRPTSGAEHMFSHALDIYHPSKAMHGEQCGVGAIMMMYLHGGNWRLLRDALKDIGAPTTAKELGIKDEDVVDALVKARGIRPERFTILGDNGLSEEAAEAVARNTMVI